MTAPRHVPALLAFVAGFCDAATFVQGGHIFSAHVTGNLVTFAADLARGVDGNEWLKLVTFPVFAITVLIAAWAHRRISARGSAHDATSRLISAELVVLLIATGLAMFKMTLPDAPGIRWLIICSVVVAMAIQNSLHRLDEQTGPFTTVMTGNVTSWLVEVAHGQSVKRRTLGILLLAFTIGCLAGAYGVLWYRFAALLIPAVVLAVVRVVHGREARA